MSDPLLQRFVVVHTEHDIMLQTASVSPTIVLHCSFNHDVSKCLESELRGEADCFGEVGGGRKHWFC